MRNTVTHPLVLPTSCRIPFIILLLGRVREYITAETTAGQLAYSTFAKTSGIADMHAASRRDTAGCELVHLVKDAPCVYPALQCSSLVLS